MKYYYRHITKREPINRFGKLGYRPYLQVVLTDDITKYNYRKHIKFKEFINLDDRYRGIDPDKIYEYETEW